MAVASSSAVFSSARLDALLLEHGLTHADVEEGALARVSMDDAEGLARVVRIAVTNRELCRNGLTPLLFAPLKGGAADEDDNARALSDPYARCNVALGFDMAEQRAVTDAGIPLVDYLSIRGTFGSVLGLRLNQRAYGAALRSCNTSRAQSMREDEAASLAYMRGRLCAIARNAVRRLHGSSTLRMLADEEEEEEATQTAAPDIKKERRRKKRQRVDATREVQPPI